MWKSGVKRRKDALPKKAAKYDTACECCGNWNQMESICKKGTKSGQNCQKSKVFGIYRTTYEISNLNFQPMLGARPYRKVHLRVFSLYLCNFPIPSLRTAETYRKKTCWSVAVTYTILYYTIPIFCLKRARELLWDHDDDKQGFQWRQTLSNCDPTTFHGRQKPNGKHLKGMFYAYLSISLS